jgi:hypothetical protein
MRHQLMRLLFSDFGAALSEDQLSEVDNLYRRGRRIARGLKRKMSGHPLRHVGAPTQFQLYPAVITTPPSR